jgi:site-specific recombinase XerD
MENKALGLHDFAFYRGLVNGGIPARELAARYLPMVRLDERLIRAEARRIQQELCAAARRNGRSLIAKMIEAGPPRMPELDAPLLEEFSARFPEGFYSEADLLLLFEQEHPQAGAARRQEQLRKRQLGALVWLEGLVAQPVQPQDDVRAWLPTAIAQRLAAHGLRTLAQLVDAIERQGSAWCNRVPGIGATKAKAIVDWLRRNVPGFEARIGARALEPVRRGRSLLAAARPRSTGIVPLEYLNLPPSSTLAQATNRVPPGPGVLIALDDTDAIRRWLLSKLTAEQLARPERLHQVPTYRCYRREAERLLLWCLVARGKPLGGMDESDALAYAQFLNDPQPAAQWIDLQRHPRWSVHWRPFAGPLRGPSRRYALTVLDALFQFLVDQRYHFRNPWRAALRTEPAPKARFRSRALTIEQCAAVREAVATLPDGEHKARLRALLSLAYTAGLRRSEIAGAIWGDLRNEVVEDEPGWFLEIRGKGGKLRDVAIGEDVMQDLQTYLALRGMPVDGPEPLPAETPLLCALPSSFAGPRPRSALSESGVGQVLKDAFAAGAALCKDPGDQMQLERASAHWLRHTFARHALEADAELADIQKVLGHASINTTAVYLDTDLVKLRRAQRLSSSVVA